MHAFLVNGIETTIFCVRPIYLPSTLSFEVSWINEELATHIVIQECNLTYCSDYRFLN